MTKTAIHEVTPDRPARRNSTHAAETAGIDYDKLAEAVVANTKRAADKRRADLVAEAERIPTEIPADLEGQQKHAAQVWDLAAKTHTSPFWR